MGTKATLTFSINEKSLKKIGRLTQELQSQVSQQLAAEQLANIQLRLKRGEGLNGRMPEYSHRYKLFRIREKKQTKVRSLELYGTMLRDMIVESYGKTGAKIYFLTPEQRIVAFANQRRSPWFGITNKEHEGLIASAKRLSGRNKK